MSKQIIIYTKDDCPQCKMTKQFLIGKNVAFKERNIDIEVEYIDYLKAKGYRSVPIVEDDDVTIIGFRPDQLRLLVT